MLVDKKQARKARRCDSNFQSETMKHFTLLQHLVVLFLADIAPQSSTFYSFSHFWNIVSYISKLLQLFHEGTLLKFIAVSIQLYTVETNVETIVCHQGRILLFSLYVHLSHCWRNLVHILLKVSILFHKNNVQSTVYLSKHQNVFVEIAKCLWQNCKNIFTNCKMYLSKLHFTLVAIRCILLKVSHCSKKTWF